MRYMRPLLFLALLVGCAPSLRAQMSPFLDPSEFSLLPCGLGEIYYPNYLMFQQCYGYAGYGGPLQTYYYQQYRTRHHGIQGYSSIREARIAYRQQGPRALDGLKLQGGMQIGHGGEDRRSGRRVCAAGG